MVTLYPQRAQVIPKFKQMIADGNKVLPLTHKEMTRFLMNLNDAIHFVLFSLINMKGGEILIPKLPSVRIVDIIKVLGCKPNEIGVRPERKYLRHFVQMRPVQTQ